LNYPRLAASGKAARLRGLSMPEMIPGVEQGLAGGSGMRPGLGMWQNNGLSGPGPAHVSFRSDRLIEELRNPRQWVNDLRERIDGLRGYL